VGVAVALIVGIARADEHAPDLVVHGHNHEFKRMVVPGTEIPIIQVASASRSGARRRAEFNVYIIEDKALVGIERHIHQPETGRFLRCNEDGSPVETH
jgi:hypothetical protein